MSAEPLPVVVDPKSYVHRLHTVGATRGACMNRCTGWWRLIRLDVLSIPQIWRRDEFAAARTPLAAVVGNGFGGLALRAQVRIRWRAAG